MVKNNVPRDDDTMRGEVVATVPLLFEGIAEKNAPGGAGREFVRHCGGEVGKTKATKNS